MSDHVEMWDGRRWFNHETLREPPVLARKRLIGWTVNGYWCPTEAVLRHWLRKHHAGRHIRVELRR